MFLQKFDTYSVEFWCCLYELIQMVSYRKKIEKKINKVSLWISCINKQSSFIEILEKIVSPTYTNSSNDPYTFFHIILEYDPSDRLHLCKRNSCILGFAEEKNQQMIQIHVCKNVHYFWPGKFMWNPIEAYLLSFAQNMLE